MAEESPTHIRLYGTTTDSIVDGPGLRYAVFTQGCPHECKGCHNAASQDSEGGYLQSIDDVVEDIENQGLIQGVTLSGGEPLAQAEACLVLARRLRERGYDLWLYSGYLYEDIKQGNLGEAARCLLEVCDVLVDGPFVQSLHHYDLDWKGSSNQRVIDLRQSDEKGSVVLWERFEDFPEPPSSW